MTSTVRNLFTRTTPVLAAAAIVGLALSACGAPDAKRDESSGEITEAADADVFSLTVGDCLDLTDETDETAVETLPTVPCTEPHNAQVFAEQALAMDELPVEQDLFDLADQFCYDQFAGYVGLAYEESVLEVTYLYPTQESWDQGDDVLQCVVMHPSEQITTSFEGAAI